jgi:hypothetical protein
VVGSRHNNGKEPACPSLNRLAALMQRVCRVRELIVADPLARVALVSVQTDLLRVHKLIKRHRATCAHCKLNRRRLGSTIRTRWDPIKSAIMSREILS